MFKVKKFEIDCSEKYIAMILDIDAKKLRLNSKDRIKIINNKNNKSIICSIEIVENIILKDINLKENEIGIYEKAFEKLEITENNSINITPISRPSSVEYIKKKTQGHRLNKSNFKEIIRDITNNSYSEIETTFFVLACSFFPLNDEETTYLTSAMYEIGTVMNFNSQYIVDKHCIGGIPNNRTSMIIVPIIAATGLIIPKSSSRSITSPAGTADTMEVLTNVNVNIYDMNNQVNEIGGCIIWGGSLDLSPADDLIIHVEHPLEVDCEAQMIASILSKKKSAGSKYVLIDIPVGETAKIKTISKAKRLSERFIKIGKSIGLNIKTIITDGSQPIGYGIGPLYEAEDVLNILENKKNIAVDLKEKSLKMAGLMLEMAKYSKKNQGYNDAKEILETGKALNKFNEIIDFQGRKKPLNKGKYKYDIIAEKDSSIKKINNFYISKLAFILGAPDDKSSGLIMNKKVGDRINKNDVIYTMYTNSKIKLEYAKSYIKENNPYLIS